MPITTLFDHEYERVRADARLRRRIGRMARRRAAQKPEPLSGLELMAYRERCYKLLERPLNRPDPFGTRRIIPFEEYRDVSRKRFAFCTRGDANEWIGTAGARQCGALILYAGHTEEADAAAALGLCDPRTAVRASLAAMLARFHSSQEVQAVLVGKDTDLHLAVRVAEHCRRHDLRLTAHLGVHAAVAIHVPTTEIVPSPPLPPRRYKRERWALWPVFLATVSADERECLMPDTESDEALDHDLTSSWQPD